MNCQRCHLKLSIRRNHARKTLCEHCEERGFIPIDAAIDAIDEVIRTMRGYKLDELAERLLAIRMDFMDAEGDLLG